MWIWGVLFLLAMAAGITAVICSEDWNGPLAPCGWGKKVATFLVTLSLIFLIGKCTEPNSYGPSDDDHYDEMDRFR